MNRLYVANGSICLGLSWCSDLRVKLVTGSGIYEEGCRWSNPKLSKSGIKATMSASQCYLACITTGLLSFLPLQHNYMMYSFIYHNVVNFLV